MRQLVDNWNVYGLRESFKAAKFPKSVDIDKLDDKLTKGVKALAACALGEGHDNFLNGIVVQFDLTMSNKAWVEAERYHFFDFVSSQSTMHMAARFDIAEQCNEYVDKRIIEVVEMLKAEYLTNATPENYLRLLYNIPSGFRLTARMTTNYRQLKTIYRQRKNHRLPEWRAFCAWIEGLPFAKALICGGEDDADDSK